jgi:hypothetical protein
MSASSTDFLTLACLTRRNVTYNDLMNDHRSVNASESQGQYPA